MSGNPYSHPYAQLLGLLGGVGIAAYGAHHKANNFDDYAKMIGSTLPDGYTVPAAIKQHGFFMGKDNMKEREALLQSYAKQARTDYDQKQELNDWNPQAKRLGLGSFSTPEAAKAVIAPYLSQDAQYSTAGQYGPRALQGQTYLNNMLNGGNAPQTTPPPQPQGPYPSGIPVGNTPGGTPLMDNSETDSSGRVLQITPPKMLSAGAQETSLPEPPNGAYITPDMIEKTEARNTTERGQDLTAKTADNRLEFDKTKYRDAAPTRAAQLRELNLKIQSAGITNQWLSAKLRSEINRNNRSGSSGGRPSSQEAFLSDLNNAVSRGWVTSDEAKKAWRIKQGLDSREQNDSTTVTRDASGSVVSTSSTTRGNGSPAPSTPVKGRFGTYNL